MADLKTNQKIVKGTNGGKREGAGRPKGSTNKLKAIDFFTIEEQELLVKEVKDMVLYAEKPDKDIAKFLWEQLFGKSTMKIAGDETLDPVKLIQIIKNGDSND